MQTELTNRYRAFFLNLLNIYLFSFSIISATTTTTTTTKFIDKLLHNYCIHVILLFVYSMSNLDRIDKILIELTFKDPECLCGNGPFSL